MVLNELAYGKYLFCPLWLLRITQYLSEDSSTWFNKILHQHMITGVIIRIFSHLLDSVFLCILILDLS